jgi:hypothetical protein
MNYKGLILLQQAPSSQSFLPIKGGIFGLVMQDVKELMQ